jgi:putative addiction module component (TIGR02574 family)
MSVDISELLQLPAAERLYIIGELWDSLDTNQNEIQIPAAHLDELDRRRERHLANPESGSTWQEIEKKIANRNG